MKLRDLIGLLERDLLLLSGWDARFAMSMLEIAARGGKFTAKQVGQIVRIARTLDTGEDSGERLAAVAAAHLASLSEEETNRIHGDRTFH